MSFSKMGSQEKIILYRECYCLLLLSDLVLLRITTLFVNFPLLPPPLVVNSPITVPVLYFGVHKQNLFSIFFFPSTFKNDEWTQTRMGKIFHLKSE